MPSAARGTGHLILKGNTYYFRMAVPKALRGFLGRSELRYSLRTGYAGPARLKAKSLALAAYDLFARLKRAESGDMIDVYKIREAVDEFFRHLLDQNEFVGMCGSDTYPEILRKADDTPGRMAAYLRTLLARHDYDRLDTYLTTFCDDFGAPEPTDPEERRVWAHEIGKHLAQFYEIVDRRGRGDYAYEKSVYPPRPQVQVIETPAAPVAPAESAKSSPLLSEVLGKYREDMKDREGSEKSIADIMSTLEHLTDILGDEPISAIDFPAMRTFRETLSKLPAHRKKKKEFRDKNIQEILALDVPRKLRLKRTTRNNILSNVSTFFAWCVRQGYLEKNYAEGFKERIKQREDEFRDVFSQTDLAAIFNAPGYRQDTFKNPWMFWVPLLLAYTGARREEICQLYIDDVREVDGVWVLDINDNPNSRGEKDKHVKNANSIRLIPIHPVLIDLGFLDYRRSVVERKKERLFPELTKIKGNYGHAVGNWFGRFRKSLGLTSEKHNLHSFRHTFIDHLKQKFVTEQLYTEVTGHKVGGSGVGDGGTGQTEAGRRYAKRFPPRVHLEEIIKKLDYGLDLSRLKESKFGKKVIEAEADAAGAGEARKGNEDKEIKEIRKQRNVRKRKEA